jgi:hypothetical protein
MDRVLFLRLVLSSSFTNFLRSLSRSTRLSSLSPFDCFSTVATAVAAVIGVAVVLDEMVVGLSLPELLLVGALVGWKKLNKLRCCFSGPGLPATVGESGTGADVVAGVAAVVNIEESTGISRICTGEGG